MVKYESLSLDVGIDHVSFFGQTDGDTHETSRGVVHACVIGCACLHFSDPQGGLHTLCSHCSYSPSPRTRNEDHTPLTIADPLGADLNPAAAGSLYSYPARPLGSHPAADGRESQGCAASSPRA